MTENESISWQDDEDYYEEMRNNRVSPLGTIPIPDRSPYEILKLYQQTGLQFYKSMNKYEITGDSGEYEFLTEAVELSKDVSGMCIEIGLRRGLGTKTIIDAVMQFCPDKTVIAVDPYGSILYKPRDHMPECRLDYTNQMKFECLAAIYDYLVDHPVDFKFYNWTDEFYFNKMSDGEVTYELETDFKKYFSMVHLDGPHGVPEVCKEIDWFSERMLPGSILVIDDITPDFLPIEKVEEHMGDRFECIKKGFKKGIWRKK